MSIARRLTTTVLAGALGLGLLAACSDDSSDHTAATTSSSAATTTTTTTAPSRPTCRPSVTPSTEIFCYSQGTAHAELTGAVAQTIDVPINPKNTSAEFPAPQQMIIGYAAPNGASVLVVGNTIPGTYPSKLPWAMGFWTAAPTRYFYAGSGECQMTVSAATEEKLQGSFTCKKVPEDKGSGKIDATGTFVATP